MAETDCVNVTVSHFLLGLASCHKFINPADKTLITGKIHKDLKIQLLADMFQIKRKQAFNDYHIGSIVRRGNCSIKVHIHIIQTECIRMVVLHIFNAGNGSDGRNARTLEIAVHIDQIDLVFLAQRFGEMFRKC